MVSMLERIPQPEGYAFSIVLRYEFPMLITLSSRKYLDWSRVKVREWMQTHEFFSGLQEKIFQSHPYHYCAMVSDCKDDFESVADRYKQLSTLPLEDLSAEHARIFKFKAPEDFHIANRDAFLSLQRDYALLAELTPKLWDEVLDYDWRRSMLPIIEAKAAEMCSALRRNPIRRFIEEYTRLHYRTTMNAHPSWAQFGGMVFDEHGVPAISVEVHGEVGIWLYDLFVHESIHCLRDQERLFQDEITSNLARQIAERLRIRGVEAGPHYVLDTHYVDEALTEALTLRILNLNVDASYKVDKFPALLPILYKALVEVHEGTGKTLAETLPYILKSSILRL